MPVTGVADLPLHDGHVPAWLARYMKKLAYSIAAVIVELYSPNRLVRLLSDPIWFQAFNNAIGMDWDSSGSTTVTLGILKQVVREHPELGLVVAGGKGRLAREAPKELSEAAEKGVLPDSVVGEAVNASRIAAKTDSVLLQDGYTLYHHSVIVSVDGEWAIVQQGMNTGSRLARRYHWLRPLPREPSLEPHSAIAASRKEDGILLDLTSRKSIEARKAIPEIAASTSPSRLAAEIRSLYRLLRGDSPLTLWLRSGGRHPGGQSVIRYYRPQLRPPRDLEKRLLAIYEAKPGSIEELALLAGVGPSTVASIALVAELVYGVPVSHEDPAGHPIDPFRYAYIVGGKDGVPYPFRVDHARAVIAFLEDVLREARLDEKSRRRALARIKRLATLLPKD